MRLLFAWMEYTFGEDRLLFPPYPTYVELRDDGRDESPAGCVPIMVTRPFG